MKKSNIIGSMGTILAIGFIVYANYTTCNIHEKKVDTTEKPISQEEYIDNIMDSIDMDCGGEYHGKEGESEYGQYESNE